MVESERPIANPVVVLREEFDDWAVLFNPDTADAAAINPVGVLAWKLMDGEHSTGEIVTAIRQSFADVPEAVEGHVAAFVSELAERGFVGFEAHMAARKAAAPNKVGASAL